VNIALIGFGTVGQGLVEILRDKAADFQTQYGFLPHVAAVATKTHGTLYDPNGLNLSLLLEAILVGHLNHYPAGDTLQRDWDALRIAREGDADVLVEASPSDFQTGQPALDVCYAAFASGKHVVLANKGPVAVAYSDLRAAARKAGKLLRFEATVMAGTPSIRLAQQALAGCQISEARGILNGTTNYILTQMEQGMPYAEALAQAQRLGYAEADPTADVEGWDAAGKAIILAAALFGASLRMADLEVKGISGITPADIEQARQSGERWKLIARVTPGGGSVTPQPVPLSSPLASVSGTTNAVTYVTDLLGEVTLVGAGAGRIQTGFGVLSDLLEIHEKTKSA
jgi:homoserine dehydrogenase